MSENGSHPGSYALTVRLNAITGQISFEGAVPNPAMAIAMLELAKKEFEFEWGKQRIMLEQTLAMHARNRS